MKSGVFFFLLIFALAVNSQKIRNEKFKVFYTIPAQYSEKAAPTYNIVVNEFTSGLEGQIENTFVNYSEAKEHNKEYYFNSINPSKFRYSDYSQTPEETDSMSLLQLDCGELIFLDEHDYYVLVPRQGTVPYQKWFRRISVEVPCSFSFVDENNIERILYNNRQEYSFVFPTNFEGYRLQTFRSEESLHSSFLEYEDELKIELRKNYFEKYGKVISNEIYNAYYDIHEEVFKCNIHYMKAIPKHKERYEDFKSVIKHVENVMRKINKNHDKRNGINWHTDEIQHEFKYIQAVFEGILRQELEDEKSGIPKRMNDITFSNIYTNILWCDFFLGNYDEVMETIAKFHAEANDIALEYAYFDILNNRDSPYHDLYKICNSYKNIFETRKDRLNWD